MLNAIHQLNGTPWPPRSSNASVVASRQSVHGIAYLAERSLLEISRQGFHLGGVQARRPLGSDTDHALVLRSYVVPSSRDMIFSLVRQRRDLEQLLVEAVGPLRNCFGDQAILRLALVVGDETPTLSAIAVLPSNFPNPEAALTEFDSQWWLKNCHRADGLLNFDFEYRDEL